MNRLEKWFLKRLLKREVKQGYTQNITELYRLVHEACEAEFTEDNAPTINAFLYECFSRAEVDSSVYNYKY